MKNLQNSEFDIVGDDNISDDSEAKNKNDDEDEDFTLDSLFTYKRP